MRVFSIPVSVPFLRTVIAALVDGRLVDGFEARQNPAKLADATLYLPTRRAGRLAREIFLDVLNADAAVLPRIVAPRRYRRGRTRFAEEAGTIWRRCSPLDIPPKLGELERRLTLARLVSAWAEQPGRRRRWWSAARHRRCSFAGDLARLMDDMVTRAVDWNCPRSTWSLISSINIGSTRSDFLQDRAQRLAGLF
jgi:ATP-dependent helicase/nuclease subunit B